MLGRQRAKGMGQRAWGKKIINLLSSLELQHQGLKSKIEMR